METWQVSLQSGYKYGAKSKFANNSGFDGDYLWPSDGSRQNGLRHTMPNDLHSGSMKLLFLCRLSSRHSNRALATGKSLALSVKKKKMFHVAF